MSAERRVDRETLFGYASDLSDRHRTYGFDVPMTDLDQIIALEYDNKIPVALIEYKHAASREPLSSSTEAIANLGRMAGIPAFHVTYMISDNGDGDQTWTYTVRRMDRVEDGYPKLLTETQFVAGLYKLRGREIPDTWLEE